MPRIVDKEEKKAQILEAAIKVFAKKGMSKTTISDIAVEADIGKGTVYEYFKSKDEVFSASFIYFMDKVETIISKRLYRIHDPLEKLSAVFTSWADILDSEYVDYMEIVLDFWAEGIRTKDEFVTVDLMNYYLEFRRTIESLLDECVASHEIKTVDTKVVASLIIGGLDGLLLQWIMDHKAFDMRDAVQTFGRIVIDGLKEGHEYPL
jgi:TetR/AcrR family fatty acid metabolism transcriptional regulator